MQLSTMHRYSKRIIQLGLRASTRVLKNRVQGSFFSWYWREKALKRQASHSWAEMCAIHGHTDVESKLSQKNFDFLETLYPINGESQQKLVAEADEYADHIFSILGSPKKHFEVLPWHMDIRLHAENPNADCMFDPALFYKDIPIIVGHTEHLIKDIKVPWELSRLQHIPVMARAYALTKDEKYAHACIDQITDWWEQNPFLLGVNWLCPMEVGIRAINLIVAYSWMRDALCMKPLFYNRFVESLYDHLWYLEHNWEIYDTRTSNHYLSNLIGYYYLCYFFSDLPGMDQKMSWCHEELLKEFDKQVFHEGMSYESSTSYHRLVTEIYYHFFLLSKASELPVTQEFINRLSRMVDAVGWCSYATHDRSTVAKSVADQIVLVGDADSGKILYGGLPDHLFNRIFMQNVMNGIHFPLAGLSIIKKDGWHMTLRHHAYDTRQPSGHFHNDVGSITVAVNGLPFIIDPGSYVYTPSSVWRNRFRSVESHNSFFIENCEPISFDKKLFSLNITRSEHAGMCDSRELVMSTRHDLYARYKLRAHRTVMFDPANSSMAITDWWHARNNYHDGLTSCWNFMLAPDVTALPHANNGWLLKRDEHVLLHLASPDLHFTIQDCWISCAYGSKVQSKKLIARSRLIPGKHVSISITRI